MKHKIRCYDKDVYNVIQPCEKKNNQAKPGNLKIIPNVETSN